MSAPKLPEPWDYAYEWDGPFGTRKLSAAQYNGRKPDRSVPIYTADQMREMWKQGLEDAAKVCKEEEDRLWRAYKGHGEPNEKGNPHTEGASDQCAVLADAIRRLKDTL